jgi:hypothetical protein
MGPTDPAHHHVVVLHGCSFVRSGAVMAGLGWAGLGWDGMGCRFPR